MFGSPLIALWAYAASSTVSGAIGKRNSDTANKVIGAPTQALFQELVLERADTFIWQKAHGFVPRTGLDAQRKKTDADAGLIAYEMAMLAKRVGQHMVANPRFPAPHASSG